MAVAKKRVLFLDSEEGVAIAQALELMDQDTSFDTHPSYSANVDRYPDNLMPFVDKHMNYLCTHPGIDPRHYLTTLRTFRAYYYGRRDVA